VSGCPAAIVSDAPAATTDALRSLPFGSGLDALQEEMEGLLLARMCKAARPGGRCSDHLKWPVASTATNAVNAAETSATEGGTLASRVKTSTVGLVGAGGFSASVLAFFTTEETGVVWKAAFDDNPKTLGNEVVDGVTVQGGVVDAPADLPLVLTIGQNEVRRIIFGKHPHRLWATLIHPFTEVAPNARIGTGTIVESSSIIGQGATVGKFAYVGGGSYVGNGADVGDYTFLAPGVVVASGAIVEENAVIGAGAVVCPGVRVGVGSTVASGSVADADVPDSLVACGVPAAVVIKRKRTVLR